MRPNQQNRRMRGRNNNNNNNNNNGNRKGPNPLTRTYESNGPDVKIRGTAQQVADKYATLARDAQSSGDRVMAENYLQHAEHYNRIIAAALGQLAVQREQREDFEEDGDDAQDASQGNEQQGFAPVDGSGPQPVIEGVPAEVAAEQQEAGQQRMNGRPRRPRPPRPERNDEANAAPSGGAAAPAEDNAARAAETQPEAEQPTRRPRRPRRNEDAQPETDGDIDKLPAFIQG